MLSSRDDFNRLQVSLQEELGKEKLRVLVCAGTGCVANGSLEVYEALKNGIKEKGISVKVQLLEEVGHDPYAVNISGCHGFCQMGPLIRIEPGGTLYHHVKQTDVNEIIEQHIIGGKLVERLLYHHPITGEALKTQDEIPFYQKQTRVALDLPF